jgi:hypothetical protein
VAAKHIRAAVIVAAVGLAACGRRTAGGLCGADSSCHVPLPVTWAGTGFDVTFEPAVLEVSGDALRLDLAGRLTHRGATELDELRLTARLLDATFAEVGRLRFDAHPSFDPPLRSGDSSAFHVSEPVPPATRHVEVVPGQVHATRAPELYAPSTPIELHGAPAGLEARYRKRQVHVFATQQTSVEGVLEIENGGSGALRALELELRALGVDGAPVGEPSRAVVADGRVPLAPGERRVARFHLWVPGAVAGERLAITRVE